MKANEAPEKLYLHPTASGNVGASWLTFPLTSEDIEYTRTDAFVEKAAEWIKNKAESYVVDTPLCSYFDYKKAVEDFKNYMKGE